MAKVHGNKAWGAVILALRRNAKLSGAETVRRLYDLGIKLDKRTLYTYEAGRVVAPDAAVVWGLARIYGVDVEPLLEALVASRRGAAIAASKSAVASAELHLSTDERQSIGILRSLPPSSRNLIRQFLAIQAKQNAKR